MNLRKFSQKPIEKPARSVTIRWPATARVAVPAGHWLRDTDGTILARFETRADLEICITLSQWIAEWETEPGEIKQGEMFAVANTHNYQGG